MPQSSIIFCKFTKAHELWILGQYSYIYVPGVDRILQKLIDVGIVPEHGSVLYTHKNEPSKHNTRFVYGYPDPDLSRSILCINKV